VWQPGYLKDTMTILEHEVQNQLGSFGARLRELRLQRGWTLQELAGQSGLSKTFLSRLESGGRQASIAAVLTLSRIFDVSLAFLFESQLAVEPCVIVRGAEAVEVSSNGLYYVPLSNAGRFFNLRPMRVRIPLARRGNEHYHHDGEEWLYVLAGSLTLSLAGKTYDLERGDAVHFDSRLPHRLMARGRQDADVLLVAAPLSGAVAPSSARQRRAIPTPTLSIANSQSPASNSRRPFIHPPPAPRHPSARTQKPTRPKLHTGKEKTL
jgi:transcriptional regulator with XRE-family HTH domain